MNIILEDVCLNKFKTMETHEMHCAEVDLIDTGGDPFFVENCKHDKF